MYKDVRYCAFYDKNTKMTYIFPVVNNEHAMELIISLHGNTESKLVRKGYTLKYISGVMFGYVPEIMPYETIVSLVSRGAKHVNTVQYLTME